MANNILHLLKTRRFLPLFITQFLGALNDNLFRTLLVTLITYKMLEITPSTQSFLVTVALGLFILPFFLFSGLAGQMADKFNKARLIQVIKGAEIVIMSLAEIGFYWHNLYFLMGVLFLMGTHSAFFGPVKYSILPDKLQEDELIAGNGLIEAGTFLAILLGTILGGILISDGSTFFVSILFSIAVSGFVASLFISRTPTADSTLQLTTNILKSTNEIMRFACQQHKVFLAILGISWFWLVGGIVLSEMPSFAKNILHANQGVFTLLLTLFALGVGLGSLLCNRMLKGKINTLYVPWCALLMTVFIWDIASASASLRATPELIGIADFFSHLHAYRIAADLFCFALLGGLYTVPLYAFMQAESPKAYRSRIIAANNIFNALFMAIASVSAGILLFMGMGILGLLKLIAVANLLVAFYICKLLPESIVRAVLKALFKFCFRVEVKGMEHYHACGKRTLIIANHTSFLDAALVAIYLPDKLSFAVNTYIAKNPIFKPFLSLVNAFPLDPTKPMAVKALIEEVKRDNKLVIFPEGRITVTGSLMKIYDGPAMIADKTGADILPIRIDGASLSIFSRLQKKYKLRLFPKITLTLLPPRKLAIAPEITGRVRRQVAGDRLYDLMSAMMFEGSNLNQSIFAALLEARDVHGKKHVIMNDITRKPLNYQQLITKSFVLGNAIAKQTQCGEYVGVLLPNMLQTAITFFALQAYGRVPTMLNFSTGTKNVCGACVTAGLKQVYTSRKFIETAGLQEMIAALLAQKVVVHYLEDMRFSVLAKILGWTKSFMAHFASTAVDSNKPAVILFTSGSEGAPKGVALSHSNLQANRQQLAAKIDFNPTDTVFNALPMFHSFGLTGGTLLPVLSGVCVFFYPSPLHYRIVPELVYDTNATILFGTDTFLSGYARFAHAYDFHSVRYVFAGAEKLKEETRRLWSNKFGVRIFEGYGATETAPILAMNTPMHDKPGTVGRLMPGIHYRLEPVPGIETGGKLVVTGPNVMLGYLLASDPGSIQYTVNATYDTGDIVEVDDEGYIKIKGRAKRFAKIAGEMISLAAVESYLADLWPAAQHAVVSIPDEKKGEQLVLVTDYAMATREAIVAYVKQQGMSELAIPKQIHVVKQVPLLGTGKVDYAGVRSIAS